MFTPSVHLVWRGAAQEAPIGFTVAENGSTEPLYLCFFFRSKFGSVRRTDESLDIQGHQRCVLEAMAYSLFRKRIN